MVIFLCDGLLTVDANSSSASLKKAARYFKMSQKLPLELQMVLCNRAFGAAKDTVLTKHSEPAFKRLGRLLAKQDAS